MKKHLLQDLQINAVSRCLFARIALLFVGLFFACVLSACVYKLDIQQGNILEREKVAQIKTGMSKRQVRFILGTPLIIDTFNQDRWDYYYSIKDYSPDNHEGTFHQERLTLFFEKDQLNKIDNQLSTDIMEPTADPDQVKQDQAKKTDPEPIDTNQ